MKVKSGQGEGTIAIANKRILGKDQGSRTTIAETKEAWNDSVEEKKHPWNRSMEEQSTTEEFSRSCTTPQDNMTGAMSDSPRQWYLPELCATFSQGWTAYCQSSN